MKKKGKNDEFSHICPCSVSMSLYIIFFLARFSNILYILVVFCVLFKRNQQSQQKQLQQHLISIKAVFFLFFSFDRLLLYLFYFVFFFSLYFSLNLVLVLFILRSFLCIRTRQIQTQKHNNSIENFTLLFIVIIIIIFHFPLEN